MARNDIGSLHVRVQADTNQFVSGMARAQATLDRTTQSAARTRAGLAQLGSSLSSANVARLGSITQNPRLGRLAGAGAIAGDVAGAAGFGAFAARGGHPAVIAALLAIGGLTARINDLNRQRAERLAKVAEEEQRIREELAEQTRLLAERSIASRRIVTDTIDPAGARGRATQDELLERVRALDATLAERRKELARISAGGFYRTPEVREFEAENARIEGARTRLVDQVQASIDEPKARALVDMARSALERIGDVAAPVINSIRNEAAGRIEGARRLAELSASEGGRSVAEEVRLMREGFDSWQRENQRASDQIATVASRISSQVTQLQYRRD